MLVVGFQVVVHDSSCHETPPGEVLRRVYLLDRFYAIVIENFGLALRRKPFGLAEHACYLLGGGERLPTLNRP
jgi:hypothetical protein